MASRSALRATLAAREARAREIGKKVLELATSLSPSDFSRSLFNEEAFSDWCELEGYSETAKAMLLLDFPDERVKKLVDAENWEPSAWLLDKPSESVELMQSEAPQLVE